MEDLNYYENVVFSSSIITEKKETRKNATVNKNVENYHECYY